MIKRRDTHITFVLPYGLHMHVLKPWYLTFNRILSLIGLQYKWPGLMTCWGDTVLLILLAGWLFPDHITKYVTMQHYWGGAGAFSLLWVASGMIQNHLRKRKEAKS